VGLPWIAGVTMRIRPAPYTTLWLQGMLSRFLVGSET
jgi:hypothetical protein